MSKKIWGLKLLSLTGLLIFNIASADTFFTYKSQPGDYIGKGKSGRYDATQVTFKLDTYSNYGFLLLVSNFPNINWIFELSAPTSEKLIAKNYLNASGSGTSVNPGINVSADSSGCNTTSGQFKVLDIAYDASGKIASLAVDFVQHCEKVGPALFGAIRYNSSVPDDLEQYIDELPYTKTGIILSSQSGDFVGLAQDWQGSDDERAYKLITSKDNSSVDITYIAWDDVWSFYFAAPANNTLAAGYYENAQSPIQEKFGPGLSVGVNGRGCSALTGRFNVLDVDYLKDGSIKHFAADFEQHCEDREPALFGAIRYRSKVVMEMDVPAYFNQKDQTIELPFLSLVGSYKNAKMKLVSENPLTFQIVSINDFKGAKEIIRFPQYFSPYYQMLWIPKLTYIDIFGNKITVEYVNFESKSGGFHVGDLFELKPHKVLDSLLGVT